MRTSGKENLSQKTKARHTKRSSYKYFKIQPCRTWTLTQDTRRTIQWVSRLDGVFVAKIKRKLKGHETKKRKKEWGAVNRKMSVMCRANPLTFTHVNMYFVITTLSFIHAIFFYDNSSICLSPLSSKKITGKSITLMNGSLVKAVSRTTTGLSIFFSFYVFSHTTTTHVPLPHNADNRLQI